MKNPFPFTNVVQKKKRLYTHTHTRLRLVVCIVYYVLLRSLKSSSIFSKSFNDTPPSGTSGGTRNFFEGGEGKQRS